MEPIYPLNPVPYDPDDTVILIDDDAPEPTSEFLPEAAEMREKILSVEKQGTDESPYLKKSEMTFEGAEPVESDEQCAKFARQHSHRWTEETLSRDMLDRIKWGAYCPRDRRDDLVKIFKLGMKYVDTFDNSVIQPWNVDDLPTHMRPWLAELDFTFQLVMAKGWLPEQIRAPHDKIIRKTATGAQGDWDPGNWVFDVMVNLMRLWRAVDENHWEPVVKLPAKEYGNSGNKSSEGPVNLRGNMIEVLLRHVQSMAFIPKNLPSSQIYSCEIWYAWKM